MMSIASVLSAGFLQPSTQNSAVKKLLEEQRLRRQEEQQKLTAAETDLAQQERDILSQEKALKASSGNAEVSTVYQYTIGEDGRRYISSASVTIKDEEDAAETQEVRLEVGGQESEQENAKAVGDDEAKAGSEADGQQAGKFGKELSDSEKALVNKLKSAETEVKAHEAAHMAAAGRFGGGVSYTYTEGPDGKSYITGGEVPIQIQEGSTPEETVRNMQQVQRAAQAPASPSGQDRQVAAKAAAIAARAQGEMIAERSEKLKEQSAPKSDSASKSTEPAGANKSTDATKSAKSATNTKDVKKDENKSGLKSEPMVTTVASGTPVIDPKNKPEEPDPTMKGVSSVMASVVQESLLTDFNFNSVNSFDRTQEPDDIAA